MTRNFFYTLLLSIVNILFPILSFPYASRILGPVGIGKVQFIVSLAQYFSLIAALGIPIYGITQAARHKDDPKKLAIAFAELTGIYITASLLLFGIYLLMIFSVPFFFQERTLYLYGGSLIFLSFCYTDWFYMGIENFRIITIRSVLVKTICILLLFLFIKTEADFGKYLLIIIFSILGNQLFSFLAIIAKTRFQISDLDFKKHLKPLLYIFSAGIAASIYTILDTVLLGFLSNDRAVGLYTASVKVVRITFPFITAMGVILMPAISKSFSINDLDQVKKLHKISFTFLTFFSIPISAGIALLAPEFIVVFSGKEFAPASLSMQILSALPILVGVGHFFHLQVLIPSGKNKEVFFSMLAGVATSLSLNFLLVPLYHETGAAIATIFTELVVSLAYGLFIRKYFAITYEWKFFFQSVISTLPFIPIVWLARYANFSMIVTLIIAIGSCAVVYSIIHTFLFKNDFLHNFVKPILVRIRENKNISNV